MSGRRTPHRTLATVVAALLVGSIAAGCGDDDPAPDPRLYATWQLQEFVLEDGMTVPVSDPSRYAIAFNPGGTASIRSDCNNCSGNFYADDESLRFGIMACTRAACPPGSLDTRFEAALGGASKYDIDTALFLHYEGGTMRFLETVAAPAQ